jgi:hypothetical protein
MVARRHLTKHLKRHIITCRRWMMAETVFSDDVVLATDLKRRQRY